MNKLYNTAHRAAGILMSIILILASFSLAAQSLGGSSSNSIVIFEDVVLIKTPTTSTEAATYAAVDDNYTAEPTTSVSSTNKDKNLTSFKSIQNSASIQSASGWETSQQYTTQGWQASLERQTETVSVTAYPNPVVDYLQVKLTDFGNELQFVELIGANGQLLKRQNTAASQQVQIDMSSLPNGSYFLRTTTLRGTTTLPISKY